MVVIPGDGYLPSITWRKARRHDMAQALLRLGNGSRYSGLFDLQSDLIQQRSNLVDLLCRQRRLAVAGHLQAQGHLEVLNRAHQLRRALAGITVLTACQARQQQLQRIGLLGKSLLALSGDGVALAPAFGFAGRRMAHVYQVTQGRVDGAGAGLVVAADQLADGTDHVIAMAGLLANQMQRQQLEAAGLKHALALVRQVARSIGPMAMAMAVRAVARAIAMVAGAATRAALVAHMAATGAAEVGVVLKVVVGMWHLCSFTKMHLRYIFQSQNSSVFFVKIYLYSLSHLNLLIRNASTISLKH